MKKPTTRLIPLIAAGLAPAAAVTSSLMSPLALSAPGDLDPGFGDVGRLGPILNGPAWSLESQDNGSVLLAGGRHYPSFYYWGYYPAYASNFVSLVSDAGLIDAGFTAAAIADTQVLDIIRQPDGLVVAAGRKVGARIVTSHLIVFRLQSDGSLDPTFGDAGLFELSSAVFGGRHIGTSIVLDAVGRIVVAGSRDDSLIVVRLLPDGSLDGSFGTSGVFTGPDTYKASGDFSAAPRTNILRTAAGGYRVTVSNPAGCQIVALTAAGTLDSAFGTSGISAVDTAFGPSTFCNSMVAQADGRLLLAGKTDAQGFAVRMLADGQPDPGFAANAVSDAMSDATAVAVGADNSIIVAGASVSGETIMRLQANGDLDVLFGNAGSTLLDLATETPLTAVVHDMHVTADGSVVAAGGDNYSNQAFVVRLLGAGGGDSPGVLGVAERTTVATAPGSNEAVVKVRRTGGASGTVSVAYQTVAGNSQSATSGQDYDPVSGRLTWADGDTAEQQVQVPILAGGPVEAYEYFRVALGDPQGGAGLGTINATIEIAADGSPFGQIAFAETSYQAPESQSATVNVTRDFYSTGAVSVTLTPIAGTATAGTDFAADPVTLSWADGEFGWKSAMFAIVDDTQEEPMESFTIELSNPTGGALLGPRSTASVLILPSDQPVPKLKSNGAGATGYWSMLLLGFMAFLRRIRLGVTRHYSNIRHSGM